MKITAMLCPNCNGSLDIREDKKYTFCPYCGVKLLLDDESKTINYNRTYRRIDEAEVERARAEAEAIRARETVRLKELELKEKKRKGHHRLVVAWIIIMVIVGGIGFLMPIAFLADMLILILGLNILIIHSDNEKEIEISENKRKRE